jgi:hypothetical protein
MEERARRREQMMENPFVAPPMGHEAVPVDDLLDAEEQRNAQSPTGGGSASGITIEAPRDALANPGDDAVLNPVVLTGEAGESTVPLEGPADAVVPQPEAVVIPEKPERQVIRIREEATSAQPESGDNSAEEVEPEEQLDRILQDLTPEMQQ